VGRDPEKILNAVQEILHGEWKAGGRPRLWDGQAAVRTVDVMEKWAGARAGVTA
jgi:hypothetical protein